MSSDSNPNPVTLDNFFNHTTKKLGDIAFFMDSAQVLQELRKSANQEYETRLAKLRVAQKRAITDDHNDYAVTCVAHVRHAAMQETLFIIEALETAIKEEDMYWISEV